jgi:hypothetical protein
MLNWLCTWTAKTRAVPSLHRDSFLAKVPGPCPVRRQVTPTNFIAGPLGAIHYDSAIQMPPFIALHDTFAVKTPYNNRNIQLDLKIL